MRSSDLQACPELLLPARAWALVQRAHVVAGRRIDAELIRRHDLPLAAYDVLEALDAAPARRLRMAELAERVVLSRSGVSRVVDKLERQGRVSRQSCDDDLRGTYAALTPEGRRCVVEAAMTHAACVREQFGAALGTDGARALVGALTPLVQALAAGPEGRLSPGGPRIT